MKQKGLIETLSFWTNKALLFPAIKIFSFTDDHQKYLLTSGRCPSCSETISGTPFLKPKIAVYTKNGKKISLIRSNVFNTEYFECLKCSFQWNMCANKIKTTLVQDKLKFKITETDRSEEAIGEERRIIDNAKSSASCVRKFLVSQEWSQAYSIEHNHLKKASAKAGLGQANIANIALATENSLQKKYVISNESKTIYSEEIEIEVPAFKKLVVVIQWKRIWQYGIILLQNEHEDLQIPYKVVVGITFDQLQYDAES